MTTKIFRISGDMSHLLSICLLILQLLRTKNARGISVKTQELYLLVFLTRYLDLFMVFYSLYNTIMKIIYIVLTTIIVCMIRYKEPYRTLYNFDQDSFQHIKFAVLPSATVACIVYFAGISSYYNGFIEILWNFSVCLEAIAIVPQLVVLQKYRLVENLTGKFMFFMGLYRALYIVNWVHRAYTEKYYRHHHLVYLCGVLQTALYLDFFYQYCKASGGGFFRRKRYNINEEGRQQQEDELIEENFIAEDGANEHNDGKLIFEHEMIAKRKDAAKAIGESATVPLLQPSYLEEG